jgi:putative nucleotidyltransferase with HDIG domain
MNDQATMRPDSGPSDEDRLVRLEKLFDRIGEVSSLPSVVSRILEVVNNETTGGDDLLKAIGGDPALAARILRTVNSASYGLRRAVTDLKSAIGLLGFREIRNLAFTIYIARSFKEGIGYRTYSREMLWNHMVAVAIAAKLVGGVCGRVPGDEAYLAGLLHDLGLILIDQHIQHRFRKVIDRLTDDTPTCAIERDVLGFDHTEIGEFVARKWRFPAQVTDAIRFHHAPAAYRGEHKLLVYTVSVANYLVSRCGPTSLGVNNVAMPGPDVFAGLSLHNEQLREVCERLDESLDAASTIAGV